MMSMPVCRTAEPWKDGNETEQGCCALSCLERYGAARVAGARDGDALAAVLFGKVRGKPDGSSCMPGVDAPRKTPRP
jgi:hypothetical protein